VRAAALEEMDLLTLQGASGTAKKKTVNPRTLKPLVSVPRKQKPHQSDIVESESLN